jgi:SAM-dependent methyltransferase
MNAQYYESLFKKHPHRHNDEDMWNSRAERFYESQKKNGTKSSDKVIRKMLDKGLLENEEILDIGGGTGRYAVPFAGYAKEVTIIDISGKMLQFAKEYAKSDKRNNLKYIKMGWEEADLNLLGWEKRFDLVFASMCGAVKSIDGIRKMSNASRKWCQINQLIEMTDSVAERLMCDLEIEPSYDPHNDRDAVQGIFNLLWLEGYEPEVTYIKHSDKELLSIDQAMQKYNNRFGKAASDKNLNLEQIFREYAQGNSIETQNRTTLSMISWKVY